MCSRNIFKKNECCRLVWAALSLGSVRNSIYLHALASCFGLLSMPLACHVQQWHSNRAGSQAPLPLDQHGLSQLCSSVRPWQLAYAEMGVIGSTWVCDEGQMFWAQAWCWSLFCVLEWNWCWPGSGVRWTQWKSVVSWLRAQAFGVG